MAFIRTKKIKGKNYAYIVENSWKKRSRKVRQETKKYLGRVYNFEKAKDIDFSEFHSIHDMKEYITGNNKERLITDLVRWELAKHGFSEDKWYMKREECIFDAKKRKIMNKRGNNIALEFNEGYLSDYALSKLINFKPDEEEDGYGLAKLFVEAGIDIPKEVFVGIFGKYNL